MEKELKQNGVANIVSFSVSNKTVTLKIKLKYDEIVTGINLLQAANTDVTVLAKKLSEEGRAVSFGVFNVGNVNFDKDRNCIVQLKSLIDFVELPNICDLLEEERILMRFLAVISLPGNENE